MTAYYFLESRQAKGKVSVNDVSEPNRFKQKKLGSEKRSVFSRRSSNKNDILFLLPPNIEFQDFISPPNNISTITKDGKQYGSVITDIPLGVISLSAYLKKHLDITSTCIDFNVELNKIEQFSFDGFIPFFTENLAQKNRSQNLDPDYVAISSLFSPAYQSVIDLATVARRLFPSSLIIVGGNLPTSTYHELLSDSEEIDAICFGEGEKALLNLFKSEDKKHYLENSSSWITHEKLASNNNNFQHDFIWDLDEIPYLDYDILDIDGYKLNPTSSRYSVTSKYQSNQSGQALEEAIGSDVSYERLNFHSMPIMTSRGCPFKCTFCASHAAHGRAMRYHSVERVIEDVCRMIKEFQITGVVIQDDHFMAGKRRPYEIVDKLGELKQDMFFQNALAIYALDPEFLKLLKASGVNELVLPVESGSERVLREEMRKPLKLSKIPEVVKNCRKEGIYTDCNVIIGMPGETKQDIIDSRKFLKTLYADWFRIFVATPIPGSEMHTTVLQKSLYKIPPIKGNYKRAVIQTEHLTPEFIQFMTYYMNIELNFVFNSNMRLGRYDVALESFENVINVKSDHAIAHYYSSICAEKIGNSEKSRLHFQTAKEIIKSTDYWDIFIDDFSLPLKKSECLAV